MSIRKLSCYIVSCDGCSFAYDETGAAAYTVHFDSPEAAENYVAEESGWLITTEGRHLCPCCWAIERCAEAGHIWSPWTPCHCRGAIPNHALFGCGMYRTCTRHGCTHTEESTLAAIPTIDEPIVPGS